MSGRVFRAKKSGTAECFQGLCLLQETKAFFFSPLPEAFPGKTVPPGLRGLGPGHAISQKLFQNLCGFMIFAGMREKEL